MIAVGGYRLFSVFLLQYERMRQLYSIVFITALFCFGMALLFPVQNGTRNSSYMAPPDMQWQLLRTADPATGTVPSGARMQAYRTLQARGYFQASVQYREADAVTGWQAINDKFPTLSVTRITYDPNNTNIYYFCTGEGWYNFDAVKGEGIFRSDDGGSNWYQLPSTDSSIFDYCQDMVVHPLTGDIYVATRSGGLQRSVDGGNTWQKVLGYGAGALRNSICDIELTADGGIFAAIGIFETDGIYFSPSGDPGTFVKQTNGLPVTGYFRIEMATAPSDPNIAYSIFCNSVDYRVKGVFKTTNKGATWFEINTPENNYEFAARQAWYDLSIAVSPSDPDVVAMGGLHLWRTRNGGDTWERMSTGGLDSVLVRYMHVDQHEVTFHTDDEVYFGNDGGIWRTDNFTAEQPFIYDKNANYNVTQYYAGAIHPDAGNPEMMGGTQDNGTPYLYDSGIADAKMVSGGDGAFVAYNYLQPENFYTASQLRRIFRFKNAGFEFPDTLTNPNLNDDNVLFINPFIMDASDPEVLFMSSNQGVWRLKNASVADTGGWQKAVFINGVVSALETTPTAPGVLFIGRNSGAGDLYRVDTAYTSGAATSTLNIDPLDSLPDAAFTGLLYCSSITASHTDGNHVVVTYSNYGIKSIWESFDALSPAPTWHCIEGDLPDIPVYSAAIDPQNSNIVYIATELGIFYTQQTNGYSTVWIPCENFPTVRTDMIRMRDADRTLMAATHGRGLWSAQVLYDDADQVASILWQERGPKNVGGRTRTIMIDPNDPTGNTVWAGSVSGGLWKTTNIDWVASSSVSAVQELSLSAAPNPASGALRIALSLPEGEMANLELFDLQGRKVAIIANRYAQNTLNWNIPSSLGPGNYLLVASTASARKVARVMIL